MTQKKQSQRNGVASEAQTSRKGVEKGLPEGAESSGAQSIYGPFSRAGRKVIATRHAPHTPDRAPNVIINNVMTS
jgi:hypothetical protein